MTGFVYDDLATLMIAKFENDAPGRLFTISYRTTAKFVDPVSEDGKRPIVVMLYDSTIVELFPNGSVRLSSNGYRTQTVQRRMNLFLKPIGWALVSRSRKWCLLEIATGSQTIFNDGIVVGSLPSLTVQDTTTGESQ